MNPLYSIKRKGLLRKHTDVGGISVPDLMFSKRCGKCLPLLGITYFLHIDIDRLSVFRRSFVPPSSGRLKKSGQHRRWRNQDSPEIWFSFAHLKGIISQKKEIFTYICSQVYITLCVQLREILITMPRTSFNFLFTNSS
jgi:hypothetical protein